MSRVTDALSRAAAAEIFRESEPIEAHPSGETLDRLPSESSPVGGDSLDMKRPLASVSRPLTQTGPAAPLPTPPQPHLSIEPTGARRRAVEPFVTSANHRLVTHPDSPPASLAQYRRLAASLHDLQQERDLKVIMVSSTVPQEGKTLTISNLALTLSGSYHRRVLLVDADLRRPSIHEVFGVRKAPGLADVLQGGGGEIPLIQLSSWLDLLPAGQADVTPLAHLTSDTMRGFVSQVAVRYDWVLIDTPPVSLLPDAQHVAAICEGVLFVIAAGATPFELIQRAVGALGTDRIIGTVLNYADDRLLRRGRYGEYYYGADTAS